VMRTVDIAQLESVERDEHGNQRLAEIDFGEILKRAVQQRLQALNLKPSIVAKNIGYELRCADPIPYDMEYTRDLGYCAAKYLIGGGHGAMVSMQGGYFVPVPFATMLDPQTGRTRVRLVEIGSARYAIARRYMLRLRRDDFDDLHELAKFAATAGLTVPEFRAQFEHVVASEPPPLVIEPLARAG
jgi:6-phosphofructokinase